MKCNYFNPYFLEQCTLLKNISTLPNTCSKHTNNILDTIIFSKENIYKIIKNLDPNKAHGHNMSSIHMIKLCGISICKPLEIIFQNCLRFCPNGKRQILFLHLKRVGNCIKNYCPVSLLLELLLYKKMFSFFFRKRLIIVKIVWI